ncbi:hypothetical protein K1T71_012248 [Dendrolimus kikuchii]|uniref:Uncharacterized protein n=1 Tax=Dendrolimus kikuchii TaxID=765133 RepID=A0ACC1CL30_9NEOP|nr:hypothetical protein K1T71_012248 [Dendrolimus kikuchii]
MDAIQEAMTQLSATFAERMDTLESELHKGSATSTTTSALATDFYNFKTFIVKSLRALQEQIDLIQQSVDQVEMRSRRKILLLHGVPEKAQENTAAVVTSIISERLKLVNFTETHIRRSHRMGKPAVSGERPRPILFKLCDADDRSKVWFAKTQLKGTGITMSEFLTKRRHRLFTQARQRFGVRNCWTRDGTVYVLGSDGTKHRIEKLRDLDSLPSSSPVDQQVPPPGPKEPVVASKPHRPASRSRR